ncbi:MAG: NifB/NifX family molybdenum-iron cluster-binding protein [Spirochaetales bacterium]|nr:NifB/NifX family molybdenum-iron cluster-binding protein [Spirochaetales bacterium]
MSIKVAIASSDGLNIDLHFGQAKSFLIYELKESKFVLTEKRELPVSGNESTSPEAASPQEFGGGCGGAGFGCGSGGGCGGSGGGCGGGASGPLAPAVELLLDCRSVVAAQIGQNMRRQFERNAISVFDIELPIEEALEKLAAYYLKFGD